MLLAMHALNQAATPPVQHARELNPYVAAALSDWRKASHLTPIISRVSCRQDFGAPAVALCSAARSMWAGIASTQHFDLQHVGTTCIAAGPLTCQQLVSVGPAGSLMRWSGLQEPAALPQTGPRLVAGTSSFGMSGVNAHGLFKPPERLPASPASLAAVPWQRTRHWVVPSPHHLLQSASFDRPTALARCAITVVAWSVLRQPCVLQACLEGEHGPTHHNDLPSVTWLP